MDLKFRQAVVDAINKDQNSSLLLAFRLKNSRNTGLAFTGKISLVAGRMLKNSSTLRILAHRSFASKLLAFWASEGENTGYILPKSAHYYLYFSRWQVQKRQILFLPKNLSERQVECKAPSKFDSDLKFIDGQLFRLSKQEATRPRLHLTLGILRTSQAFFYA